MTPEERARALIDYCNTMPPEADHTAGRYTFLPCVVAAVREAVAAETERCAAIARRVGETVVTGPGGDCVEGCQGVAERIEAAIRARKDGVL